MGSGAPLGKHDVGKEGVSGSEGHVTGSSATPARERHPAVPLASLAHLSIVFCPAGREH